MPSYIAFLRGINLGKRRVTMARLTAVFEEIGHSSVKSFIASGNILFDTPARNTSVLEKKAGEQLQSALGYEVDVFIRPASAVAHIARTRHFADDDAPGVTVHVAFLHEPLPDASAARLVAVRTRIDEFKVDPHEFYWLCRTHSSDSEVWTLPEIKALRLPSSTMRNLKTIRKLAAQHLS